MNILIITPRIPYPPFRGDKLKIFNISKQLSKNNSITILTFYRNKKQLEDVKHLQNKGLKVITIKLTIVESFFQIISAAFSGIPFQVAWFKSNAMKKRSAEIIHNGSFDVVYYHLIRSSQYIVGSETSCHLNILDFTDAVSLYLSRFQKASQNPLKKLLIGIEKKRIIKYEKIAEKFHTLFICSEVDRDFLLNNGLKANIKLLKNGIDTDYFNAEKIEYDKKRIIFTGNMPYFANYDAVLFFVEKIFPLIIQKEPEIKFYIVGQNPPGKITNLQSENIIVTGFVPDIKKEYLKSAVNIAPMRFGAGTLNKVLESIILGVPVVATSMAIGGLPKELDKYVFVADDVDQFADAVLQVLSDNSIREEVMPEGREVIKNLLSWEKIVKEFENYLIQEVNKRKIEQNH